MTDHVRIERQDRVMKITLDRPEAKNALTHAMYATLAETLARADADPDVRCAILTGAGDAFTAGNDLGDFAGPMPEGTPSAQRFLEALRDAETPVVAAVDGAAIGIGLTLLLHCDLAFASEKATFSAPFARLGLVPEAGSSLLLPRALGTAWANDILLAGRTLAAGEALAAGLVSRVVPSEDLPGLAAEVAERIASYAPNAVRETKRLVRSERERVAGHMGRELEVFLSQLASPEFAESLRAFREGRPPDFE